MENSKTPPMPDDPLAYGYRLRGVNFQKQYRKAEYKNREKMVVKLAATLHHYWHKFASEQFFDVPVQNDLERAHMVFLNFYARFLWRFKKNRKSTDPVRKYWHGVRVRLWDYVGRAWKELSNCHASIPSDSFYEDFASLAVWVGYIGREMEMFAEGKLNAHEYIIHHELSRRKGAEKRHAENRAMKSEVFAWLDANMRQFKSMDDAATAIAGKVAPIAWRTARDWVGEWKKLRSAGTA